MKKLLRFAETMLTLLGFLYLMQEKTFAQIITIGTATLTTTNLPTKTDVNYSYSQQIYTNTEITQGGAICGISFRTTSNNTFSRNIKIYLGHTTQSTFSSGNNWIPGSSLTQVFSGNVPLINNNWVYIPFDVPFIYNGTQNLVIAVDDNTQIIEASSSFQYSSASNKTLYFNSSTTNPSITTPPNGTISDNRNNIKIHFCSPTIMTNTPITGCEILYSDPGGLYDYSSNNNFTQTITASTLPNTNLVVDFMELSIGSGDTLWIYNGPSTLSPLIGFYTNITYPFQYSGSGTALTFRFKSDNINSASGWLARIYCSSCDPVSILSGSPCQPNAQNSTGYAASPFCTDVNPYGVTFPSATTGNGDVFLTTPVGCLTSVPRPAWYFMQINTPGNMLINISQTSNNGNSIDVDFACWGPFYALNQADFMHRLCCGEYELYRSSGSTHQPTNGNHTNNMGGYPINNLIDCSYAAGSPEWCYIPNAQSGQFYLLLLTNYNGGAGTITFNTVAQYTTATTDCSLLAQVSNNGPVCSGGNIQLTCNNPQINATYSWTGPNGFTSNLSNPIISNVTSLNSGVYTLVMTVNSQSSAPASTTVVVNPVPNVNLTASTSAICQGSNSTLTASGATNYVWNNGLGTGNSKTITPNTTTTYQVTGTSSGCSDTAIITITVRGIPSTQITTPASSYCPNSNTIPVSTITTGGGGTYSYIWTGTNISNVNNNNTQITINPSSCNTLYSAIVKATDQYGCFGKDTARYQVIDTTPPLISPLPFPIQTASGTFPNYSIPDFYNLVMNNCSDNCYPDNLLIYSQIPAAGSSITAGTFVTISVTDPCGNTKLTYIRVILPLHLNISDSVNVSCYNGNSGSATVSISGGIAPYSIVWNTTPTQTTPTASNLGAGNYQVVVSDSLGTIGTTSVQITQPTLFTTTLNPIATSFCPNYGNITLHTNTLGGVPPYQYSWSGNGISNNLTDSNLVIISSTDCNESYQPIVSVTDQMGCIASDTTFFTIIDTISPQFTTLPFTIQVAPGTFPNYTVPNLSTLVMANSSDNCWPNDQLTYSQSLLAGSTITTSTYLEVTITDPCGNARTTNIRLILPLHGVMSNSQNVNCYGQNNGSTTVTPYGGIPPFSYIWDTSPIQNSATASQLSAGNYNVTITDSLGTTYQVSISITQPPLLSSLISATPVLCYGQNNGSAQITANGGTPGYTYLWNNGATTASLNNLTSGNYLVTITDAQNCTSTNQIIVNQPTALTLQSTVTSGICQSGTGEIQIVTFGGIPPYTFNWNTGATTSSISNLGTGIYICTVTDFNGCTKIKTDTIMIVNPMSVDTITSILESCGLKNGSIQVTIENGTPPYNYVWNNGISTGTSLNNLKTGYYNITVTDQNQCTDTTGIFIDSFDIQSFIDEITPSICDRDNGTATIRVEGGTGLYNYLWYNINDFTDNFAFNLAPGNYYVSIKDLDCIDTLQFIISEIHKPIACFETSSDLLLINQSFLATNCSQYATHYHWEFGDGISSSNQNPSHFYNESGMKEITLYASNDYDCIDSVKKSVIVNEVSIIYIPNSFTPNNDGLNDIFKPACSFVREEGYSLKIFNRWGEEIFFSNDIQYGWDGTHNAQAAPSGTYSYIILYENLFGQQFRKIGSINIIR
ncbi:MAG: C-terminal target protein [Bacteroidetes bacterium]|nr:C-terminal target protein [Bacteroidota bacterium]